MADRLELTRFRDPSSVPYWHLLEPDGAEAHRRAIGAETTVAMHVPATAK